MTNHFTIRGMALALPAILISSASWAQDGQSGVNASPVPDLETPETANDIGPTVFDGDWVTIGIGASYGPSYDGSDDYVVSVLPVVQGSVSGIDISPRAGGLALDFVPNSGAGPNIDAGVAARIRRNRASNIEDPVVESLGELDTAIEVGPTVGIGFPAVLNPYDTLSFTVDAKWDVADAHDGVVLSPSATYFTPLSRAAFASLSLSAEYADDDFAEYYFTVSPSDAAISGLPQFDADGGFNKASVTLLSGYDLSGDATDGGFAVLALVSYSHMLGDAKDTPFTSVRGDADQYFVGAGIGYTF
ncbi:MipA/OmpV family protein [Qipengyuania atrilutea]|uniref:MipA/OmpV family protein n=1 Tax=Qipengyuania atrilutea TaxID=2744473 RepID=A0A850H1C1_9SPHN|nr:MipA/OmpV family protein [Actirhodobacter atriluteus]NVD45741.1 MipA/OmpV family protein [Actirhodobacter atriluteus]